MSTLVSPHADDQAAVRARVRAHRRVSLRSMWPYYAAVALIVAAAAFGVLWSRGWVPGIFAPDKLVVRGSELTDAKQIIAAMGCDGTQAVPALWVKARGVKKTQQRWLQAVGVRSGWGRTAVIEVAERRPLIQLVGAGFPYWLCDDGRLIAKQGVDSNTVFSEIARLPKVALPDDPGEGLLADSAEYLQLVAACDKYLPGQVERIELNREEELFLYQKSGFEIRLGRSEEMIARIAALPQVLRVCEGHKDRLRYLYATEVNGTLVFYEKWKGKAGS
jgi:cell division septal protein FtsQ